MLTSPTVPAVLTATRDRLDEMTEYLVGRGLLADRRDRQLVLAPLVVTVAVLVVVAVAIVADGGGVDAVVPAALIVGVLLAGAVLRSRFGRTRAGDEYLRAVSERYSADALKTPRDWAYAVAVHGPAALGTRSRDRGEWQRSAVAALTTDDYRRQSAAGSAA